MSTKINELNHSLHDVDEKKAVIENAGKEPSIIKKSLPERLADGFQLLPAFCRDFGICHFEFPESVHDNRGNDQPGILLLSSAGTTYQGE